MADRRYVYPAIFTPEAGAYSVIFPDLEIATSGETLVEAMDMAQDALCLQLYDLEEHKEAIPAASSITDLDCPTGSFASLIECDTMEYRRYYDNKAVKKTLSIPSWLNTMAEREDINFSAVLQKALKAELNLS
jgi:predicted RNase H-like HicB family nuclease